MKCKRFEYAFKFLKTDIERLEQFIKERKKKGINLIENDILKDLKDALKELKKLR